MRFDSFSEAKIDDEEVGLAMAMATVPTTSSSSLASSPEGYSSRVTNALGGTALFLSKYLGVYDLVMSTHTSIIVDSVGPPSAEVCRTIASFPEVDHPRFIELREVEVEDIPLKQRCN
jgi:hypothetical protein